MLVELNFYFIDSLGLFKILYCKYKPLLFNRLMLIYHIDLRLPWAFLAVASALSLCNSSGLWLDWLESIVNHSFSCKNYETASLLNAENTYCFRFVLIDSYLYIPVEIVDLLFSAKPKKPMALSFTRLPWLWLGGNEKEQVSSGPGIKSINSLGDWGFGLRGEPESLKFYSVKGGDGKMPSSSCNRKSKRKWKSREERRRIDREYDVVLVPSDGVCLSGWESDDSDWSIGWLEPHAPDFQSDDKADDSFAVLVPCYRHDREDMEEEEESSSNQFLTSVKNLPNDYYAEGKKHMEQWLSSLHNF